MRDGFVKNKADFIKSNDINQAVSTGLSKRSYDEEIMYHLKQKTNVANFNLIQVNFIYNDEYTLKTMQERKHTTEHYEAPECSTFWYLWELYWGWLPYHINKLFGGDAKREWNKYECTES